MNARATAWRLGAPATYAAYYPSELRCAITEAKQALAVSRKNVTLLRRENARLTAELSKIRAIRTPREIEQETLIDDLRSENRELGALLVAHGIIEKRTRVVRAESEARRKLESDG